MKKILFVASVTRHIKTFHLPYLKYFKDKGYEVHVASNGDEKIDYCDKHFNLCFERSPFKLNNLKAYKQLKKIIDEGEYEIVHCHTPVASILTRKAARKMRRRIGTKVIYTAHGFHFYKGAPLKNWLIYYPIEKKFAKDTDILITINKEDYEFAKRKLKAKKVVHVHGIGVNPKKFMFDISEKERDERRANLTIKPLDFLITYVAELNNNKNQMMLLEAMNILTKDYPNIKLLLAGDGVNKEKIEKYIREKKLQSNVLLLGYRTDIPMLLKLSDLYVATSKREGLPVNIVEAMISGLPVVATDSRGQRELVSDGENGYIVKVGDYNELATKIKNIYLDYRIRDRIKEGAKGKVEPYLFENVMKEMKAIYKSSK